MITNIFYCYSCIISEQSLSECVEQIMRKKKSRSSVSLVNKIVDKMSVMWISVICLSLILATISGINAETVSNVTQSISELASSRTTQQYAESTSAIPKQDLPLVNVSSLANFTTEGRSRHLFVRSGNELWDGLVDDCLYKPSFSCFQKNIFLYLDKTLKLDDVNITDRILFKKIDLNATQHEAEQDVENEIPDNEEEERSGMHINNL